MKSLLTAFAAFGLLAIAGTATDVAAETADVVIAGEVVVLEHGRHWDCQRGPVLGWWHRNAAINGLPVLCLLPPR